MPLFNLLSESFRLMPHSVSDKPSPSQVETEFNLFLAVKVEFDFYPGYPASHEEQGAVDDLEVGDILICRDNKFHKPPAWLFSDTDIAELREQLLRNRHHEQY